MKGKLIVIEGTDGSGKGTQSTLLVERLVKENIPAVYIEFPQYGKPSAKMVEEYLNGRLGSAEEVGPYRASIFYAVDRYSARKDILKWLDEGKVVVCNRYVSANLGHQACKISAEKLPEFITWVEDLEYGTFELPRPDAVLLLHMPVEIGQRLVDKKGHRDYVGGAKKDLHEGDLEHLRSAEQAFLRVAELQKWHILKCNDGDEPLPIEIIHEILYAHTHKILSK
ncbi:MAG: dTMP kinase [Candidatus Woesearchaeota archaeon]